MNAHKRNEIRKTAEKFIRVQLVPKGIWRIGIRVAALMITWFFHQSIWQAILVWFLPLPYLIYVLLSQGFANGMFMEMINYFFI